MSKLGKYYDKEFADIPQMNFPGWKLNKASLRERGKLMNVNSAKGILIFFSFFAKIHLSIAYMYFIYFMEL